MYGVLAAAFLRSLKDPFPHARAAGISAILGCTEYFSAKDMATRLLPSIVALLVDSSGEVRTAAFKALADFEQKLSRNHEEMLRAEASGVATIAANKGKNASTSTSTTSGWGLSSFSSIAAALVHTKGDTATQTNKSTGRSSEDFKRGRPATNMNNSSEPQVVNSMPITQSVTSSLTTEDAWKGSNGKPSAAPLAFSRTPLPVGSGRSNAADADSFGMFGDGNENASGVGDDDDADGWGDMDIKSSSKAVDDEDLFVSMMGEPKSNAVPKGLTKSSSNSSSVKSGGDDGLWDLAPPKVSRPKPRAKPRAGTGLSSVASARRAKKAGGNDDWEALLDSMDVRHRDRLAFIRIFGGRFEKE